MIGEFCPKVFALKTAMRVANAEGRRCLVRCRGIGRHRHRPGSVGLIHNQRCAALDSDCDIVLPYFLSLASESAAIVSRIKRPPSLEDLPAVPLGLTEFFHAEVGCEN